MTFTAEQIESIEREIEVFEGMGAYLPYDGEITLAALKKLLHRIKYGMMPVYE